METIVFKLGSQVGVRFLGVGKVRFYRFTNFNITFLLKFVYNKHYDETIEICLF
jgi:hypothetical protein